MRKLHRAGAAVAAVSLVLSVSAFTVGGTPGTEAVSPGGPMVTAPGHSRPPAPPARGTRSSTR